MVYVWFMMFNATFNNISVISWRSVLLVEETRVPRENHQPVACHWQTLSHNVVSSTPHHERGFKLTTSMVIGTDCTGSYKSNYPMITTTTALFAKRIFAKWLVLFCTYALLHVFSVIFITLIQCTLVLKYN
jgi:hypothetical protein